LNRESKAEELQEKKRRIEGYIQEEGLEGLLLARDYNFAWATAGRDNHVTRGSEEGASFLLFDSEKAYLLTTNIEAPRLREEELSKELREAFSLEVIAYPWYEEELEGTVAELGVEPEGVRTDVPSLGFAPLGADFFRLRKSLTPGERERYRSLGEKATEVMEDFCRNLEPGLSEMEIAGSLGGKLMESGMEPSVLLVGSDERARKFRHPVPQEKCVEDYVMVVICARREGQVVSLTRCIHFGSVPKELRDKFSACAQVDAAMIAATRPGRAVGSVVERAQEVYAEQGFPGEWKHHHQGGPTGYKERDYLATAGSEDPILEGQAFAWNPSIQGAKSEDTILVEKEGAQLITEPDDWPTISVETNGRSFQRPDLLKL